MLPTLFTLVNNIIEPESGVTILLTTVNNVGSKTLFNPVFINYCNNLIVFSSVVCFAFVIMSGGQDPVVYIS